MNKPLKLMCLYTSGVKPLNQVELLPNHDDWGIKYLVDIQNTPIVEWQKICENLYVEAKVFLKEEAEGVFVRNWQNEKNIIAFAISDRESKGSMRRNILIAIFCIQTELSLQKIVSQVTFAEEPLPIGLKELKKNPEVDVVISTKQHTFPMIIKLGVPVQANKEKDINRTTTSYMPTPKNYRRRKNTLPWIVAISMAALAVVSFSTRTESVRNSSSNASIGTPWNTTLIAERDQLATLEKENVELKQKLDLTYNKLREKTYELNEKDSIIAEIGGWESFKVLVQISKKYQIDRAEKLQLVLEEFKRKIEQQDREKQSLEYTKTKAQDRKEIIKRELRDIFEYLENLEKKNTYNEAELYLSASNWQDMKKKLKYLFESE